VVIIEVVVDREGRVADSRVLREPGFGTGEAALTAVDRWRFRPATLDGRPVAVFLTVTVRFQC
jgi:protein TonB